MQVAATHSSRCDVDSCCVTTSLPPACLRHIHHWRGRETAFNECLLNMLRCPPCRPTWLTLTATESHRLIESRDRRTRRQQNQPISRQSQIGHVLAKMRSRDVHPRLPGRSPEVIVPDAMLRDLKVARPCPLARAGSRLWVQDKATRYSCRVGRR